MHAKISICLIDDHQALTDAMAALLNQEKDFEVKGIAHNYQDGKTLIELGECDIYIIDMNLGKEDSCELISLSKLENKIPIVLSAYSDLSLIKKAMKSGAMSYISKTSASSHIIKAIKETLEGRIYYDEIIQGSINTMITPGNISSTVKERQMISQLTPREKDVIRLIAQEYTSEEIAKELHLSKNTVDGYRKNLISKLGVRNSVGLINMLYQI